MRHSYTLGKDSQGDQKNVCGCPNDNFDLETSHVLPAIIRKIHLAKCLENEDWDAIRKDLNKRPSGSVNGNAKKEEILELLKKHGIEIRDNSVRQEAFIYQLVRVQPVN